MTTKGKLSSFKVKFSQLLLQETLQGPVRRIPVLASELINYDAVFQMWMSVMPPILVKTMEPV